MNVIELTGDPDNQHQGHVWSIMGPISFSIITVLLSLSWFLYRREIRIGKDRQKKEEDEEKQEMERLKPNILDDDLDD